MPYGLMVFCTSDNSLRSIRNVKLGLEIRISTISAARSAELIHHASGTNAMDQIFRHRWVDPSVVAIASYAVTAMPAAVAREENVMPVALAGGVLTVAVDRPMDFELVDKLRFICNLKIELVMASPTAIRCAVARHYGEASDA
jgi:Type II secretion system (T2SS), protein E, N-terminal domain